MSKNNPMKNPEFAKKAGDKHKRPIIINKTRYDGLVDAARAYGVAETTVVGWCKKGGNPQGELCYYEDEGPKPFTPSLSTKVPIIVNGIWYESKGAAAKAIGAPNGSCFNSALKNGILYKGQYKCEYANQQPSQGNSNNSTLEGSTTNE